MEELNFTFGTMGSSKTAQALIQNYTLMERGHNVLFLKPAKDTRDEEGYIKSRINGLGAPVFLYNENDSIIKKYSLHLLDTTCIIVDEVQFSTPNQIRELKYIVDRYNIPVYTYGLRSDFQTHLFEGSKRLFELADNIYSINSKCHCGRNTIVNARYCENGIVKDGPQVLIGGNESYKSLCLHCWDNDDLGSVKVKK